MQHSAAYIKCPIKKSPYCDQENCAMWRWAEGLHVRDFFFFPNTIESRRTAQRIEIERLQAAGWTIEDMPSDVDDTREHVRATKPNTDRKGYCGLGGRPEFF